MKTILVGRNGKPVMVDDDFVAPEGWSLSIANTGYVRMMRSTGVRRPGGSYVYEQDYLARWITGAEKGKVVIFRDDNHLNLQRDNLRVCERVNSINRTGRRSGNYKGVHWGMKQSKWIAQITHNGKCHTLGSFDCEHHAASAYNHAAVRFHGEHAHINTLPEET